MTAELETEVLDMCNLGSANERKGMDIGKLTLAAECVKSGKMSVEDASELLKMTVEEFKRRMDQLSKEVVNA